MSKSKKQKLKVKDFQKKKLKVGKAKPKPSNVTDTSFVSKTISIRSQHLAHDDDLSKRLPLLKHHNSTVRRETLQTFHKMIPKIINTRLMTPLLNQSIPLICDDSRQIRTSLMELIEEIGVRDSQVLKLHCKVFILYLNMAMTHIMPSIQTDSTKFLKVLLRFCGPEVCSQSFTKMLLGSFSILGWSRSTKNQSANVVHDSKRDSRQIAAHLEALSELIKHGCTEEAVDQDLEGGAEMSNIQPNQYLIPECPQPYEHLKLFTRQLQNKQEQSNADSAISGFSSQDVRARQTIVKEQFLEDMRKHCDSLIKDGGEPGKWANTLNQLLEATFKEM
ncbi:hypothetical protein HG536_0E02580 [Torulaspora globosa]|uniref:Pre-rRNA-processing protein n=1 Tax=Torulaspora globosa TaxID=48254 RepID=A0A7G3ZIL1_9SACH|nr:uncharacterized protein HG536_0E02580 [Torulaspora globosa]QLL33347.1 hypothetical protein HG536_0E02580 [Torulaspora globosa]